MMNENDAAENYTKYTHLLHISSHLMIVMRFWAVLGAFSLHLPLNVFTFFLSLFSFFLPLQSNTYTALLVQLFSVTTLFPTNYWRKQIIVILILISLGFMYYLFDYLPIMWIRRIQTNATSIQHKRTPIKRRKRNQMNNKREKGKKWSKHKHKYTLHSNTQN